MSGNRKRPTWWRLLKRAEQNMLRAKGAALKPAGLTLAQYVVLDGLEAEPGITAAALARNSLVTPQALVEVLRALEERELVAREPHPRHPTVLELRLTDAGRDALRTGRRLLKPVETRLARAVPAADEDSLVEMLTRIVAATEPS